jgi:hypothetical protein
MAAVNPIMSQSAGAPTTAGALPEERALSLEQKMLDYIAAHQAEGLAKGQQLGNPSALAGEALKTLKGYFERATALQDSAARRTQAMDTNGNSLGSEGGLQLASLSPGPASGQLERAGASRGPGEKISAITDADLEHTVEALMKMMHYTVESTLIGTATNNVSKSVMTLIHGQ